MGESQGEGGGAAVVDDDVAFGRRAEVHEGGGPLVLGVEPVEVDREAVVDPVEGADPALGVQDIPTLISFVFSCWQAG